MGRTLCAACDTPLLLGKQDDPLCSECLAVLTPDQRSAYRDAVHHVYCAPAGKFAFFQRQLEMVVEDLAEAVRARRVVA